MNHVVLLVDDEPNVLTGLARALHKEPYTVMTASSAEEAAAHLETDKIDVIVCDEQMPGMSGIQFLASTIKDYPDVVRIVLTGQPSLETALHAINEGKVYHFFEKPCNDIELAITIRHALEQKGLLEKGRELLEATRQQSSAIDKARVIRRLREVPPATEPESSGKTQSPESTLELINQMGEEACKSRELSASLMQGEEVQSEM